MYYKGPDSMLSFLLFLTIIPPSLSFITKTTTTPSNEWRTTKYHHLSLSSSRNANVDNRSNNKSSNKDEDTGKRQVENELNNISKEYQTKSLESLDTEPLLNILSQYCVTKRGRDALLKFTKDTDKKGSFLFQNNDHSRNARFYSNIVAVAGNRGSYKMDAPQIKLASSLEEAKEEYGLVKEAMDIAKLSLQHQENDDTISLWPWGSPNNNIIDDDYDEWLKITNPNDMKLQHVIEAEQIIKKMIETYKWCIDVKSSYPKVSTIVLNDDSIFVENINVLHSLYNHISDKVKIMQIPNIGGTSTTKKYKFQLNLNEYPELQKLYQRLEQKQNNNAIKEEITTLEETILHNLSIKLFQNNYMIQSILDSYITRLDLIFAKAYFGLHFDTSVIPKIKNDGIICIDKFIHPLLAFHTNEVVPIKLQLSNEKGKSILVISGPNGGGKTLTLKSFGLVCIMMKLGIPIPTVDDNVRIDYFDDILVDIGDHQNVLQGESTFMSKLNSYSRILRYMGLSNILHDTSEEKEKGERYSLVLLDELASGSDEKMASSLGQALLEHFVQYSNNHHSCRVVTTTHSSSIKTMSLEDDRFNCASMSILYDDNYLSNDDYNEYEMEKKPTYKIIYGETGQSYAFNAASHRCHPPLPKELLYRAYNIYDNNINTNSEIPTMMETLELQKKKLQDTMKELQDKLLEVEETRKATYLLAQSYDTKLSQFDKRLQHIVSHLDSHNETNEQEYQYKVIGKAISELRLMKQYVKDDMDAILKEKGLKLVLPAYQFYNGESVVIVKQNDALEGVMANVVIQEDDGLKDDEVRIIPSFQWEDDIFNDKNDSGSLIVKRNDIAIWDYKDDDDYNDFYSLSSSSSALRKEKQDKLFQTLKEIETSSASAKVPSTRTMAKSNNYTSARERKAANKKNKKKEVRNKRI